MDKTQILWADDEIDLLKPHIIFLESKGYQLHTTNNGHEAIKMAKEIKPDLVLLDENMPGLSGLDTLLELKNNHPDLPVVMITKNEEEHIMEEAIGSKISDYLIKPVKPSQILLSIKKNIDQSRLISEETTSSYQQEFRKIGMKLMDRLELTDWKELSNQFTYWDLQMDKSEDKSMQEIFEMQKKEANSEFSKFVVKNYKDWMNDPDGPIFSHDIFKKFFFNSLRRCLKVHFLFVRTHNC